MLSLMRREPQDQEGKVEDMCKELVSVTWQSWNNHGTFLNTITQQLSQTANSADVYTTLPNMYTHMVVQKKITKPFKHMWLFTITKTCKTLCYS